jgi:hypothetical protein
MVIPFGQTKPDPPFIGQTQDWARRGILPSRKIGRRRIYIRQDIEAVLTGSD